MSAFEANKTQHHKTSSTMSSTGSLATTPRSGEAAGGGGGAVAKGAGDPDGVVLAQLSSTLTQSLDISGPTGEQRSAGACAPSCPRGGVLPSLPSDAMHAAARLRPLGYRVAGLQHHIHVEFDPQTGAFKVSS